MKRLLCITLAAALLLCIWPLGVLADTAPTVTAAAVTVQQGSTVTVNISAANFSDVAAADITLYYDPDILTVTKTVSGGMINGSTRLLSVNTDTAGQIRMSASAVTGFSASGTLARITFQAAADAPAGSYPLTVTVGDAYGTDLAPLAVSKVSGTVTVKEKTVTVPTFSLSAQRAPATAQKGDTVTVKVSNSGNRYFAAAEFVVTYDDTMLKAERLELDAGLQTATAQYSVNTATAGTVRITYAAADAVNASTLFHVYFTVIGDTSGSTSVSYTAANIYDDAQQAYTPYTGTVRLTLQKLPETVDYPNLWLESEPMVAGQQTAATVMLEKGAAVAAGDFVITYDPAVLRCISVTPSAALGDLGGMVMVDDNFADGTIEFPYVNADGYCDTDIALVEILWEVLDVGEAGTAVTPSASMVYDAAYNKLTLEAVSTKAKIAYTVAFYNADGSLLATGNYHYADPIQTPDTPTPPAGTDPGWVFIGWDKAVSPTCQGSAVYTAVFAAPYLRGDMNRDDTVTDADAVYLLRHTLFAENYPIFQDGDFNGDGVVTDADAVYLLRHTLFPENYPI